MDNYIAPEIPGYAVQVLHSALGSHAELQAFRWGTGGLYNKVYRLDTTDGSFVLKLECSNIFPSTRRGQIANEVEGSRLLRQAGVLCPPVAASDLTGRQIGVQYILTECLSSDWPLMALLDRMDGATKAEVARQQAGMSAKIAAIPTTHFGSLLPAGPLGWHGTWDECYRAWFELLMRDCDGIGLFTDEERSTVGAAAARPLGNTATLAPIFSTEDMGTHNLLWGHTASESKDVLYAIDFGNSRFIPPHLSGGDAAPFDIPNARELDRGVNLLLLYEFERMLWTEAEKLTQDYAHIRSWMVPQIEAAKRDTSRAHVRDFVERCGAAVGRNAEESI